MIFRVDHPDKSQRTPVPGWYRDPELADTMRSWDGMRWTDNITPTPPQNPDPPVGPPQPAPHSVEDHHRADSGGGGGRLHHGDAERLAVDRDWHALDGCRDQLCGGHRGMGAARI